MKLATCLKYNTYLIAFMSDGLSLFAALPFYYMLVSFYTASSSDVFVALNTLDSNCRSSKNSTNNVVF